MELLASITANLLIYTMLLVSLNNFVVGKTSILPVGHTAFFGVGAFATGMLIADYHVPGWPALALAVLCGALICWAVGVTALRLAGDYFILLSISLCELVRAASIAIKGPSGYTGVARPMLFGLSLESTWALNGLVLVPAFAAVLLLARRFNSSPLERICVLTRQHEAAARLLRIPTVYYKIGCFCAGSVIATLAGGLYTLYTRSTDPTTYTVYQSIMLLAMVLFGGVNSIRGSVVGGLMLVLAPRLLEMLINSPASSYYSAQIVQVVYGVLLVTVIRFAPHGVMGEPGNWAYGTEEV
jgi:branched-chain amino acid transport system permease protein